MIFEYNGEEDDQNLNAGPPDDEEVVVDPFAAYLEEDDDDDEGTDDDKAAKKEEARLKALVDAKLVERLGAEHQERNKRDDDDDEPPVRQQQQQQSGPPAKSMDETIDALANELTEDLAADPKKAVKKLLELNARLGSEANANANARANKSSIDFYLAQKATADPEFKEYEKELRKKVEAVPMNVLSQYTADSLKAALDQESDAAYGRYMRGKAEKARGQRTSVVPAYGGGDSRPSRGNVQAARLTASQKQLIKMGESAGLDKKAIRELLKEA